MIIRPLALALALATATCIPGNPAFAEEQPQAVCGTYAELSATLRERFGETPRFRADENRGFALEFFAQEGGGWTLLMRQGERACAIAAGTAWRALTGREDSF